MRRAVVLLVCLGLAACVRPAECIGPAGSPTQLQCDARSGLKPTLLELAKRYETGAEGVPRDPKRAAALYRAAARFTSGTTYVYSPPVGKSRGMVLPVRTGADQPGLPEATYRLGLMYLDGRGVRFDFAKGHKLIKEAAAKGWPEAAAKLKALASSPRT